MKKLICLLSLLLIFSSCAKNSRDMDIPTATKAVIGAFEPDAFVRADDDFIATNFGAVDHVEESAVYYTKNGDGTEFGFFRLSDAKYTAETEGLIRDYLASERESVEALAALYPAKELNERLARFDNATVGTAGNTVYYFLTEPSVAQTVIGQFK